MLGLVEYNSDDSSEEEAVQVETNQKETSQREHVATTRLNQSASSILSVYDEEDDEDVHTEATVDNTSNNSHEQQSNYNASSTMQAESTASVSAALSKKRKLVQLTPSANADDASPYDGPIRFDRSRHGGSFLLLERLKLIGLNTQSNSISRYFPFDSAMLPPAEDVLRMGLLPPEPIRKCEPAVQSKIVDAIAKQQNGTSFNDQLRMSKDFHNPYILAKIADLYKIAQNDSCYPRMVYDPEAFDAEDMYERLAEEQIKEEERLVSEYRKLEEEKMLEDSRTVTLSSLSSLSLPLGGPGAGGGPSMSLQKQGSMSISLPLPLPLPAPVSVPKMPQAAAVQEAIQRVREQRQLGGGRTR
jgi:hypothetical protein